MCACHYMMVVQSTEIEPIGDCYEVQANCKVGWVMCDENENLSNS